MARISGVDLPANKKILVSLTYIYGIGLTKSSSILKSINISPDTKTNELTEEQVLGIRNELADNYIVEGELRSIVGRNVKRLIDVGTYKGMRHKKGLPVNGQNTKNNARTRKGKKRTVGMGKKVLGKKG